MINTPAARLSAAIEVLSDIETARRPASDALKEWGLKRRFAGSSDRAAIAGLVYDALRRKASSAFIMEEATPRANLLGMLALERGHDVGAIEKTVRRRALCARAADAAGAPCAHRCGTFECAAAYCRRLSGMARSAAGQSVRRSRVEEGAALSSRAPLDLRVNTLKGSRDEAVGMMPDLDAQPARWSPTDFASNRKPRRKIPAIHAEPAFIKGLIEIQDEGSQLAALVCRREAGEQVVDLCAGAGGKTLALAAAMDNKGQIFATDTDKRRLAPIHARLERAGARNVQVRTPERSGNELKDLKGQIDLVLIDAPCTGTGSWRRNPDAKWRLRPGALEIRRKEQVTVLERAVPLLKAGGRIAYITCSVLDDENGAQVRDFVKRHPGFSIEKPASLTAALGERGVLFQRAVLMSDEGLLMTPRRTGTDGFYISMLQRS